MDVQKIIATVIILAAFAYVGQMVWRRIKSFSPKDKSCGNDCGCDAKSRVKH